MQQKCPLISQLKQQGDTKPNLHDVLTAANSCYAWDISKIAKLTKSIQYERWLHQIKKCQYVSSYMI